MYGRLKNYLYDAEARQRAGIALARGGLGRAARTIDLASPDSWEFGGFSQNGEDGIIDLLRSRLLSATRSFLEIGSADGIQNNTAWLALVERLDGIMLEADPRLAGIMQRVLGTNCIGSRFLQRFVTRGNARELPGMLGLPDPDLFSLDIDGNDHHIARTLLEAGLRPRIVVVEYNSVFGPDRAVTVPYRETFELREDPTRLYYGASLMAWRRLFESFGYRFLAVERNGVNAFFVDPAHFEPAFLAGVAGRAYAENKYQHLQHGPVEAQWALIRHLPLDEV